jgi:hypothetical protein
VAPEVEEAVVAIAVEQPAWGQVRAAKAWAQRGSPIAAAGVRCGWERNGRENLHKRRRALEAKGAQASHLLTAAQLAAWEKAKGEKEAQGEVERECPGSCGAQDTFSVGTLKGVGRIYPQPCIATYSNVAFAKLYDRQTSLTAAELLNEQVVPVFEVHEVPLSRVLPDRGTEYGGSPDPPESERYWAVENLAHSRPKVKSPQPKGIVERFPKTLLTEFYRIPFRKKIDTTLADLQTDLDGWLREYNENRVHPGRWCYGRTPLQTFLETIPLAKEKLLAA